MHTGTATWELPGYSAVAGSQTAWVRTSLRCCSCSFSNCIQVLCIHFLWRDTNLHARGGCYPAAVQWQDTNCMHEWARAAAVAGSQTA
jgi:hypothetical protein